MSFSAGQASDSSPLCRQLTFSEIQTATQNFDESLVIGRGGFGKVYKGTIRNRGIFLTVAIKRLDSNSNQGAPEFWAEVQMLSTLRHCHLLALIGYCTDGQEMILVYEYMPRGTLEDRLHKHGISVSWLRRLKICIGAARGLDYLHTGTGIKHGVIHRDVKSSNILLDDSWEARISDFGLSKICPKSQPSTYVSTFVKGTFGYLDPDYFYTGKLTRKSDVYAFGVVLLEVLCGKRAVDESLDEEHWGLVRWAQDSIKEGRLKQIIDTNIIGIISPKCLKAFLQLANRCLHTHPKQRPTMAEIVAALESVLSLQEKVNATLQPAGMAIFGRMLQVGGMRSEYLKLKLYLDTLGSERGRLYPIDFDTISIATNNFSEAISYFPFLYKGRLPNGIGIAVRRPKDDSDNTRCMNEASMLAKVEHDNLVQLLGYCIEGTKLLLVYEFAVHGTLDSMLSDPTCILLDWNKRYKILLGVARALLYLHEYAPIQMMHCNVKPGNILLNESLEPKLSGFEHALAINETDSVYTENVCGTIGYISPEYLQTGIVSPKNDVYGFGMLILETIHGRRLWYNESFNPHIFSLKSFCDGTCSPVIDPRIEADSSLLREFMGIGWFCVQIDPVDRPRMKDVVCMLNVARLNRKQNA